METATEKPSAEQRALLNKLILSSVFTAEEAHRTAIWLNSPAANKERATEVIDDALARIKKRDQAKKASKSRKAEFHANKDNGNGGEEYQYPPRRYSNENPPANGKPATESPPEPPPETTPAPLPAPEVLQEQTIYRINGVDYTDKNEAAEAASKAIFG